MTTTFASEAGHWYDKDGVPRYTYTTTDGRELNTTLRQARKYGWFPSVSGIIDVGAKPALENWKLDELAKVCGENPREVDESLDNYVIRVRRLDREKKALAPDLGTHCHACIETHIKGGSFESEHRDSIMAALAAASDWCGPLGEAGLEKSYAHSLGYGGRVDLYTPTHILDWKTAKFTKADLPKTWPNHAMQLAAGREGLRIPNAAAAIIFISTTQPGLAHLVRVMEADLVHGWELFCAYLTAWKIQKKYDPCNGKDL